MVRNASAAAKSPEIPYAWKVEEHKLLEDEEARNASSTQPRTKHSLFLSLPLELRETVYREFFSSEIELRRPLRFDTPTAAFFRLTSWTGQFVKLIRINEQIRGEVFDLVTTIEPLLTELRDTKGLVGFESLDKKLQQQTLGSEGGDAGRKGWVLTVGKHRFFNRYGGQDALWQVYMGIRRSEIPAKKVTQSITGNRIFKKN